MGLGVERAVAEILRDGDPARSILGLAAVDGFTMYDVVDTVTKKIHVAEEPGEPDETVTVILEGGGLPVAGSLGVGMGRQPAFTVRTRGPERSGYEIALTRAHVIHNILDEFEGLVHGVPFWRINANTEPIPLGRDRQGRGGRWIFSQTFRAQSKRYSPS